MAHSNFEGGWIKFGPELVTAITCAGFSKWEMIVLHEAFDQIFEPKRSKTAKLSPSGIAAKLGTHKETIVRATRTLIESGVLVRSESGEVRFVREYSRWTVGGKPRFAPQEVTYFKSRIEVASETNTEVCESSGNDLVPDMGALSFPVLHGERFRSRESFLTGLAGAILRGNHTGIVLDIESTNGVVESHYDHHGNNSVPVSASGTKALPDLVPAGKEEKEKEVSPSLSPPSRTLPSYSQPLPEKEREENAPAPQTVEINGNQEAWKLSEPEPVKKPRSKKTDDVFILPNWIPPELWERFLETRRKLRKPPTEYAKTLIVKELVKLQKQGHEPVSVLEQSIRKGYQDVFAVHSDRSSLEPLKPPPAKKEPEYHVVSPEAAKYTKFRKPGGFLP